MVGVGLAQEVNRWQLQGVVTNVTLGSLKYLGPKDKVYIYECQVYKEYSFKYCVFLITGIISLVLKI